jgi:hypothetical protein
MIICFLTIYGYFSTTMAELSSYTKPVIFAIKPVTEVCWLLTYVHSKHYLNPVTAHWWPALPSMVIKPLFLKSKHMAAWKEDCASHINLCIDKYDQYDITGSVYATFKNKQSFQATEVSLQKRSVPLLLFTLD